MNKDKLIFYPTIDDLELGLESVSFVNEPAIELNFLMFNKEDDSLRLQLSTDDKMVVTGPALIPNKEIYRHDEEHGDYWIVFTEDTIKSIVLKYFKDNSVNNINNEHTKQMINGTMIESWFSKQENELGYDVPVGTWFTSYQIEDKDYWNDYIKSGKVKGYSIEGLFKLVNKSKIEQSIVLEPDEIEFNKIKKLILELDEQTILEYFTKEDVGVKITELDLSNVQYTSIDEDEYTRINLDIPDVYYYYWKKDSASFSGGGKLTDDRTRTFCKDIVSQAKYFSASEIVSLSAQLGYSVFTYCGQWNCRHQWVKATNFKFLPRA